MLENYLKMCATSPRGDILNPHVFLIYDLSVNQSLSSRGIVLKLREIGVKSNKSSVDRALKRIHIAEKKYREIISN